MYCPICGIKNEDGHKYCSECGSRLPVMSPQLLREEEQIQSSQDRIADDLMALWRLYESNDFDGAVSLAGKLINTMPESTSARSVLALVYEKRASLAEDSGDDVLRTRNLDLAAHQYERVLEANPESEADRAKLAALRRRLLPLAQRIALDSAEANGLVLGFSTWQSILQRMGAAYMVLPQTFRMAMFVFLVLVAVAYAIWPGRNGDMNTSRKLQMLHSPTTVQPQTTPTPTQSMVVPPQAMAPQPQALPSSNFPIPTAGISQPQEQAQPPLRVFESNNRRLPPALPDTVEPLSLTGVDVKKDKTLPKKPTGIGATQIGISVVPDRVVPNTQLATGVTSTVQNDDTSDDGDTWLARAGEFRTQGQNALALAAVEKAIKLYESDIKIGRNTESAINGSNTAKALKQILENQTRQ